MSKFVVDLEQKEEIAESGQKEAPESGDYQKTKKHRPLLKVFGILAGLLVLFLLVGALVGFLYLQSLKSTPQYSLALLVDAARRDDQKQIGELVDVDAVVDDFIPQVTDKALELYGRGLPPQIVKRVEEIAIPLLPGIKQRAKAELPGLLREKTKRFENIPFWAMVIGGDRYLDIKLEGDKAMVKSLMPDRPLEVKMKRNGDKWQIIAVRDEKLARQIAERIGQEIIRIAKNKSKKKIEDIGKELGIDNLGDMLKQAEDIFK